MGKAISYNFQESRTVQSDHASRERKASRSLDRSLDLLPSRLRLYVFGSLGCDLRLHLGLSSFVDVLLPGCPD